MAHNGSQQFNYHPADQPVQPIDQSQIVYPYNDDEDSLLDPAMLESSVPQHPHNMQYRRASLSQAHAVISPAESQPWDTAYRASHHINSGLSRLREGPDTYRSQHPSRSMSAHLAMRDAWPQHDGIHAMDIMPADGQHLTHGPSQGSMHHNIMSQPPPMMSDQPYFASAQIQTPNSPQSHKDWMAFAQQEQESSRPLSKRVRPHGSPRGFLDLRRDGAIQKKNKRIDIPHERNIQTIDQMIETTKDEDLLKELKAQKRLLRNREAALASRQRKKKHTEELEKSEKSYVTQITTLEKENESLLDERHKLLQEREILMHRHQDADRVIEAMHMEKRDLLMKHNEETASLRKKVQVLMEQLESVQAPSMSAEPSSSGFTDFNAEMQALSMDGMGQHDWDDHFMLLGDMPSDANNDFTFGTPHGEDIKPAQATQALATMTSSVPEASTDKPVVSGLLFMLLLFGAFVASRPSATLDANLPQIPADVQAAAPTVLSSLLGDSSAVDILHTRTAVRQAVNEPAPSSARSHDRKADRMAQLHRSLTAPTRQQEIDSAFALTPAQYAALTNSDALQDEEQLDKVVPTPQRTLAEALAAQSISAADNKAAVYTRSLLWDQIPADVVQQFKQIVRDAGTQPIDDGQN